MMLANYWNAARGIFVQTNLRCTADGAGHVSLTQSLIPPPELAVLPFQIITAADTAQALPADLSPYTRGIIVVSGLTVDTWKLEGILDGPVVGAPVGGESMAGAAVVFTGLSMGTWRFPVDFKSYQITKTGVADTITATFYFKRGSK